ncbi:MAG: hypothetical protein E7263_07295 [Lachnospiraceae bacterium]|nr:hypothetical protein [Lachnospiraceae bacterium]
MDKQDIILIGGIIVACIWLVTYILFDNVKIRRVILAIGCVIDIILFFIGKNADFLLAGIIGGAIVSFIPGRTIRQRENAIKESKGFLNYLLVCIVFTVMILMLVPIAFPGVEIVLE